MKTLDYKKSKVFWDNRAEKVGRENFLLATTLQDDLPAISDYRNIAEKKHVSRVLKLHSEMKVLDLGGGTGRWAIEFAKRVKEVTLVDFSPKLLDIAKQQTREQALCNIHFIESSVLDFNSDEQFDVILISGVLMYINDADVGTVAHNCFRMLKPEGHLILREGVNLTQRVVQIDEYSKELESNYSVIWRKPEVYLDIFGKMFNLVYMKDAFPYLIPVFFYKRFLPDAWKKEKRLQDMLRRLLMWQAKIDHSLLAFDFGLELYHKWLRRQRLGIIAQLYIFKKEYKDTNHLYFAGKDIVRIARNKNTPFFLISEKEIKKNYNNFIGGFLSSVTPYIYYSIKTNYESGLLSYIRKLGVGAEIGSAFDLFLAQKAGFAPHEIILDGLYKDDVFLEKVICLGIKTINSESFSELKKINAIAQECQKRVTVGIRINLTRWVGDWRNVLIDRIQKTYGFEKSEVVRTVGAFKKYPYLHITSLMVHTSKSFTIPSDYQFMLKEMFKIAYLLRENGIEIKEFNLGGGIPTPGTSRYRLADFSGAISNTFQKQSRKVGFTPSLSFELGKGLVGNAGILIGRVCDIRNDWVIVDISRSDFGFSFPFRKRPFLIANKCTWPKRKGVRVGSSNLEKFDVIKKRIRLPHACVGDIVVLRDVGAYSLPLSTQFTRPRSAVYLLTEDGEETVIRREERPEDVIATQNWDVLV